MQYKAIKQLLTSVARKHYAESLVRKGWVGVWREWKGKEVQRVVGKVVVRQAFKKLKTYSTQIE